MFAVDTNVLIRIFVRDDEAQFAAVRALVEAKEKQPLIISSFVIVELVRVLRRHYKLSVAHVADIIQRLLIAPEFALADADLISDALALYQAGQSEFADCVIALSSARAGAKVVFTFDRDAVRAIPLYALVPLGER